MIGQSRQLLKVDQTLPGQEIKDSSIAYYTHITSALLLPSIHNMQVGTHTLNIQGQIQMKTIN